MILLFRHSLLCRRSFLSSPQKSPLLISVQVLLLQVLLLFLVSLLTLDPLSLVEVSVRRSFLWLLCRFKVSLSLFFFFFSKDRRSFLK